MCRRPTSEGTLRRPDDESAARLGGSAGSCWESPCGLLAGSLCRYRGLVRGGCRGRVVGRMRGRLLLLRGLRRALSAPLDAGFLPLVGRPAFARVVVFESAMLASDFAVTPFLSWYLPFSGRST